MWAPSLPLVVWASIWNSHLLAMPTSFVTSFSQHNLQAGQIVGPRFGGLVGDLFLPLEELPDYRRWPVHAPYATVLVLRDIANDTS